MPKLFIIIDGPMGSGKTTLAALLHKKIKRSVLLGADRIKWSLSDFTRNPQDNKITREVVLAMCAAYMKHDLHIIIEQGFIESSYMTPFLRLAKKAGRKPFVFQLTAPKNILLERVKKRPKPLLAKAKVSKSRTIRNIRIHAKNKYASPYMVFDSSALTPQQIMQRILKELGI